MISLLLADPHINTPSNASKIICWVLEFWASNLEILTFFLYLILSNFGEGVNILMLLCLRLQNEGNCVIFSLCRRQQKGIVRFASFYVYHQKVWDFPLIWFANPFHKYSCLESLQTFLLFKNRDTDKTQGEKNEHLLTINSPATCFIYIGLSWQPCEVLLTITCFTRE